MKDNKFKVLCILAASWLTLFLVTIKVKSPLLEGVEAFIWFAGMAWFAYWTVSTIRAACKKKASVAEQPTEPSKETKENASSKESK